MKELDCVEVTIEKEKYTKDGVHQGMQGWICDSRNIDGSWLVNFPVCGEEDDIATIAVKEKDLKVIPAMHAAVNERIKAQYHNATEKQIMFGDKSEDLGGYLI